MLMQNFGVTNKEHYGMLWYFLEWSIVIDQAINVLVSQPRPQGFSLKKWVGKPWGRGC